MIHPSTKIELSVVSAGIIEERARAMATVVKGCWLRGRRVWARRDGVRISRGMFTCDHYRFDEVSSVRVLESYDRVNITLRLIATALSTLMSGLVMGAITSPLIGFMVALVCAITLGTTIGRYEQVTVMARFVDSNWAVIRGTGRELRRLLDLQYSVDDIKSSAFRSQGAMGHRSPLKP